MKWTKTQVFFWNGNKIVTHVALKVTENRFAAYNVQWIPASMANVSDIYGGFNAEAFIKVSMH